MPRPNHYRRFQGAQVGEMNLVIGICSQHVGGCWDTKDLSTFYFCGFPARVRFASMSVPDGVSQREDSYACGVKCFNSKTWLLSFP